MPVMFSRKVKGSYASHVFQKSRVLRKERGLGRRCSMQIIDGTCWAAGFALSLSLSLSLSCILSLLSAACFVVAVVAAVVAAAVAVVAAAAAVVAENPTQ